MTADVELLPLPDALVDDLIDYADRELKGRPTRVAIQNAIQAYARANVAHATAAKAAEIEALRAEVAEWKRVASAQAELHGEAEARAERLAEALRIAEAALADIGDADREPGDDVEWCERRAALGLRVVRDTLRNAALHPTAAQENDDA